jgi:hypothetical protein
MPAVKNPSCESLKVVRSSEELHTEEINREKPYIPNNTGMLGFSPNSTSYGSRTRDLRLERAAS